MPVFDDVLAVAGDQHGLITTADARAIGLDPTQLRVLAHRGRLERVSRGVYRVAAFPIDAVLPFAEAAAWAANRGGVVTHEAALAMRELGDFNPSRIDITLPAGRRFRMTVPSGIRLRCADLAPDELDRFEGVETVTVYVALRQVIAAGSDPHVVRRAISDAYRTGAIGAKEANRLRAALKFRTRHRGVVAS